MIFSKATFQNILWKYVNLSWLEHKPNGFIGADITKFIRFNYKNISNNTGYVTGTLHLLTSANINNENNSKTY